MNRLLRCIVPVAMILLPARGEVHLRDLFLPVDELTGVRSPALRSTWGSGQVVLDLNQRIIAVPGFTLLYEGQAGQPFSDDLPTRFSNMAHARVQGNRFSAAISAGVDHDLDWRNTRKRRYGFSASQPYIVDRRSYHNHTTEKLRMRLTVARHQGASHLAFFVESRTRWHRGFALDEVIANGSHSTVTIHEYEPDNPSQSWQAALRSCRRMKIGSITYRASAGMGLAADEAVLPLYPVDIPLDSRCKYEACPWYTVYRMRGFSKTRGYFSAWAELKNAQRYHRYQQRGRPLRDLLILRDASVVYEWEKEIATSEYYEVDERGDETGITQDSEMSRNAGVAAVEQEVLFVSPFSVAFPFCARFETLYRSQVDPASRQVVAKTRHTRAEIAGAFALRYRHALPGEALLEIAVRSGDLVYSFEESQKEGLLYRTGNQRVVVDLVKLL